MVSSSTPIPSKNALRALRHLAFSTPTLVAGAVGSACCVAALSCEARSRVKLAEKIVATKRTLRAVSNGQGNTRVTRMFEAAEKGENFLLDPQSADRRRRVRHYTAKAAAIDEDDETLQTLQENLAAIPVRRQTARRKRKVLHWENNTEDATFRAPGSGIEPAFTSVGNKTKPSSSRQQLNTKNCLLFDSCTGNAPSKSYKKSTPISISSDLEPPKTPAQSILGKLRSDASAVANSDAAERIRMASMAPHKSAAHAVHYTHPKPVSSESSIENAPNNTPDLTVRKLDAISHESRAVEPTELPPLEFTNDFVNQPLFSQDDFLNVEPGEQSTPVGTCKGESESLPEQLERSPEFLDAGRIFSQAYQYGFPDAATSENVGAAKLWRRRLNTLLSVYDPDNMSLDMRVSTDMNEVTHAENSSEAQVVAGADHSPPPDHKLIGSLNDDLHETVSAFLASHELSGLEKAERAFDKMYNRKKHGLLPVSAAMLIHRLLADESTKHRALRIFVLAPDGARTIDRDRLCEMRIMLYMQKFSTSGAQPATWKSEFRKIAGIVSYAGMALTARCAETFLRCLCWAEQPAEAESVYNELQEKFGFGLSLQVERVLALGYASSHDWSSANRIMAKLQELQIPRDRPAWYSITFQQLFKLHLRDHNFDASYDYLINAMGYWKLAPSNHISRVLVAACIKARRFNILQDWIETTRQMWPRLESGVTTMRFAYEVSRAWTEVRATSKDIENTCRALASGSLKDPFSTNFRSVLRDALAAAMERQYVRTLGVFAMDRVVPIFERNQLSETSGQARKLIRSLSTRPNLSQDEHAAIVALQQEVDALEKVDEIVAGSANLGPAQDGHLPVVFESVRTPADAYKIHGIAIPAALERANLPPLIELWTLIADLYVKYCKAGQSPPHDILNDIAQKLAVQGRHHEAVRLLRSVHSSPFVKGKDGSYFDGNLYLSWLEMCEHTGSPKEGRLAMWALIDACRSIKLTAEHMAIVALCTARHQDLGIQWGHQTDANDEAKYLQHRLRKQRWIQLGASGTPPKLSGWTTWQEQITASRAERRELGVRKNAITRATGSRG